MRKYLLIALLSMGAVATFAQKKAVTEAKNLATQEKPDYKAAEELIKGALENDETKNDVKTWYTAGYILNKKYEDERNKKLLKQKTDEPAMYKALQGAYNYWIKAIELDKLPDAKGKVKPKYEKEIKDKIKENIPDLVNAGVYYYDLKNYKMAYTYFDAYNQASINEYLKDLKLGDDANTKMLPYYASLAALNMNDDEIAIKALEFAKNYEYERYRIYYFLAETYNKTKQQDKYIATLLEAHNVFKDSLYFSGNLINSYINKKDYDNAIKFLSDAIAAKPSESLYIALGEVYQESGKNEELAKGAFNDALKLNPNNTQAYFYLGRLSFNKAIEQTNTAYEIKDKKKQAVAYDKAKALYREALPFFKKSLELQPDAMEYMNPLRTIYYNLNMNKEYDALDKIITAKQKGK